VPKNRGRPRLNAALKARIVELHDLGGSMRSIEGQLAAEGRPVAYNTIRNVIDRESPPDASATWRLAAYDGLGQVHPELVLPILAGVHETTGGRVATFSNRVADWVAALRLAASQLSPWTTYVIARRYVAFEALGRDTGPLDLAVAIAVSQLSQDDTTDVPAADGPSGGAIDDYVRSILAAIIGGHQAGVEGLAEELAGPGRVYEVKRQEDDDGTQTEG
jgi:hypothetical protein